MMSNTMKQLRQLSAIFTELHKLLSTDQPIAIRINHLYNALNCLTLDVGGYRSCGLVFEAIRCVQVVEIPGSAVVKVVQGEEGTGVEVGDVVFLYEEVSYCAAEPVKVRSTYQLSGEWPSLHHLLLLVVPDGTYRQPQKLTRLREALESEER